MSRVSSDLFIEESNATEQTELVQLFTLYVNDAYIHGTGYLGSPIITVDQAMDLTIGQYITIAGIEEAFKIIDVVENVVTVERNLPVTITNVVITFTRILNLADSNYDLCYDGMTYLRFPIKLSETTVATDGSIDRPTISVGNVTRELMYYIEQYDGLSNVKVEVKKVYKKHLDKLYAPQVNGDIIETPNPDSDVTAFVREEFLIDSYSATEKIITFMLEPVVDLEIKLPRRRYLDSNSCSFRYKDPETCKYSGSLPTCYKNLADCKLHNNAINFGGFAGLDSSNQRRIWL